MLEGYSEFVTSATMAGQEPLFFAKARRAGRVVVDGQLNVVRHDTVRFVKLTRDLEPPKLDLEAYIANYKGSYFPFLPH